MEIEEVEGSSEGLTEEEAWQLLLSLEEDVHYEEEPEPVVVRFIDEVQDGMALDNWTLCQSPVKDTDADVTLCSRTAVVDDPEFLAELKHALPEVMEGVVTEAERDSAGTLSPTIPGSCG